MNDGLLIAVFWSGLTIVAISGGPWGLLVAPVAIFFWWAYLDSVKQEREAQERSRTAAAQERKEEGRRLEEERRRNSPEEVARRKREEEQRRAEQAELERLRQIAKDKAALARWEQYHKHMQVEEVDDMSGVEFENLIMRVLQTLQHNDVEDTSVSGDQGADILCVAPDGKKVAVQTKRWKGVIGNRAIQEVMGALVFYDCERGYVITNSRFTDSAKELASKDDRIVLINRQQLAKMLSAGFPREVPAFDQEKYDEYVRWWRP